MVAKLEETSASWKEWVAQNVRLQLAGRDTQIVHECSWAGFSPVWLQKAAMRLSGDRG